jgi:hypothetical protein
MLMSPDLFLDCILCILNDNSENLKKLIGSLIHMFEVDSKSNTTIDNDVTKFYIRVIKQLMVARVTKDNPDELRVILLKFQSDPVLSKRKEIYQLLHDTFLSPEKMSHDKLSQLIASIRNTLLWHDLNKSTRQQFAALSKSADMLNPLDQAAELQKVKSISEGIGTAFENSKIVAGAIRPQAVEHIDFTDKDSMKAALQKHNERAVSGIMKMGLQGLNRMFGERNGLARGESLVIYALKHNYKSGLLMSIATWASLYNNPSTAGANGNKKKLILLISLENEAYQNFVWMFRHHYESTYRKSSKGLTDEQVSDWCIEQFAAKGFVLMIERHLPDQFTAKKYEEIIEYYENSGYEVVLSSIDYVNLMNKTVEGTNSESNHLAVRAIFSKLCNYNKSKGITFCTAHPLNRKAAELRASGVANVVKRFDESHLADSVDVAREVDLEVFINIEKNLDGVSYLTFNRGKHRYVDNTPDAHKYCAYRFQAGGIGIVDDILTEATFVTDIYSDPLVADAERGDPSQPVETDAISVF